MARIPSFINPELLRARSYTANEIARGQYIADHISRGVDGGAGILGRMPAGSLSGLPQVDDQGNVSFAPVQSPGIGGLLGSLGNALASAGNLAAPGMSLGQRLGIAAGAFAQNQQALQVQQGQQLMAQLQAAHTMEQIKQIAQQISASKHGMDLEDKKFGLQQQEFDIKKGDHDRALTALNGAVDYLKQQGKWTPEAEAAIREDPKAYAASILKSITPQAPEKLAKGESLVDPATGKIIVTAPNGTAGGPLMKEYQDLQALKQAGVINDSQFQAKLNDLTKTTKTQPITIGGGGIEYTPPAALPQGEVGKDYERLQTVHNILNITKELKGLPKGAEGIPGVADRYFNNLANSAQNIMSSVVGEGGQLPADPSGKGFTDPTYTANALKEALAWNMVKLQNPSNGRPPNEMIEHIEENMIPGHLTPYQSVLKMANAAEDVARGVASGMGAKINDDYYQPPQVKDPLGLDAFMKTYKPKPVTDMTTSNDVLNNTNPINQ